MVVVRADENGLAPSGLSPGDFVQTNGGMYRIANPGDFGAKYNDDSGYWSTKYYDQVGTLTPEAVVSSAYDAARANTEQSQAFAREQMDFQAEQVKKQNAFQIAQNAKAMDFNAAEAAKSRDWQEYMSNTAHQREVKDLIAAGLNPVLSANNGAAVTSGATASGVTSSGSSASGASGNVDTSFNNIYGLVFSQMLQRKTSLDIAEIQAAVNKYAADTGAAASIASSRNSAAAVMGAASINAANAYAINQANINQAQWMAENYPSTIPQALASFLNGFSDSYGSSGSYSVAGKGWAYILDRIYKKIKNK